MLRLPGGNLPLKALPVALPNTPMPIGLITVKNRLLTPVAQLFIDRIRARVKSLARSQPGQPSLAGLNSARRVPAINRS
jgi:DNA-binding transcriptional LysR family regulator